VSVSVEELLSGVGSVVPDGAVIVAVLTSDVVSPGRVRQVTV
jgi:hypothetical protein